MDIQPDANVEDLDRAVLFIFSYSALAWRVQASRRRGRARPAFIWLWPPV